MFASRLPTALLCLLSLSLGPFFFASSVQAEDAKLAQIRGCINKGNALLAHNLFKEAIDEYEKCLELDPNNSYAKSNIVLAHNNWGIHYFHDGQYELAKQEWQTVLNLRPNDRNARNNLAIWQQTMVRLGKPTDSPAQPKHESNHADEKGPPSVVVILKPAKRSEKNLENTNQALEYKPILDQVSPDEKPTTKEQASNPGNKSDPPVDSLGEFGSESGAKIILHKQDENEAVPKIDESIDRLESKIYGQPRRESSVIMRLEKMELDSCGKISDGPITERIAKLKRLFSIDN